VAEDESRAPFATRSTFFDGPAILRLGLWTLAACVAVALAVFIGNSQLGLHRIAMTLASVQGVPTTLQGRDGEPRDDGDMQRLSESLRQINGDRNRMIARLETIERHLDDLTGSINRGGSPTRAPDASPPPPAPAEITTAPVPAPSNATIAPNPAQPAQQASALATAQDAFPTETQPATKVDFGVDLGSAQTIDGLRVLWTQAKGRHGALLDGMRPIITIRESARPGNMELRLVVGPLPSAAIAARLCVMMTAAGAVCQPAVFDGQRLALR
jgi:hypothetical protein